MKTKGKIHCKMSVLNLLWAVIILVLTQDVICFLPERQINVQPINSESVTFPLHDIPTDDNERAVYDPGDDTGESTLNLDNISDFSNEEYAQMVLKNLENEIREQQDIATKSAILMKLIEDPNVETLPIVYVEENPMLEGENIFPSAINKRSRYYRRYPWKRQNSRYRQYEADTRYLCVPSREDVFKLLVGIHENRSGNHQKTVNFCNRKRPAKAIFTNIRFLG